MYKIRIHYKTGNSFGSRTEVDDIEYEWKNKDDVKQCLKRIKNHYEYYEKYDDMFHKPTNELPVGVIWNEEYRCIVLELIDDGQLFIINSFWTGYFETLYKAEIIFDDNDLIYEP